MSARERKFGQNAAPFRQRLAQTVAWPCAENLVGCPEDDANTIQRRGAVDGTVLKTESSEVQKNSSRGVRILTDDAEKIVKSSTFSCTGYPPNAPFEHIIKFIYKVEDDTIAPSPLVVMNLPDEVIMTTNAVGAQPADNSKKGSH